MYEVRNDLKRRTMYVRLSGFVQVDEMQQFRDKMLQMKLEFGGSDFVCLADMRGLKPMSPESAQIFGDLLAVGRGQGVKLCAHLSDSTLAQMQTDRLARQVSPEDDVTVRCESLEEAERVLSAYCSKHWPSGSDA
jgi:hypothetical protein